MLFGIPALDPATYGVVAVLLITIAGMASERQKWNPHDTSSREHPHGLLLRDGDYMAI